MSGQDLRQISCPVSQIQRTPAEIDIFKPNRMKAGIEAIELLPKIAAEQDEGPSRLFHVSGLGEVGIQVAVAPIDGVARKYAIQPENFACQRGRGGEAADGETALRLSALIHKLAGGDSHIGFLAGVDQGVDRGE